METQIQDGSLRTLWRISFPLILSFLSILGMVTVDRIFLSHYSAEALGAAVSGGMAAWALVFGGQTLTNASGIFVAQHNGADRHSHIGRPVWQMIWLSLILVIPFAIIATWAAPWLFSGSLITKQQILYFRWSLAIGPLTCLEGALIGFFVGRGKTGMITWLTLLGNLINLVLDPILIFGWGAIPSLGLSGACIATGIGLLTQTIIMFALFLKENNRRKYFTTEFAFDWPLFRNMVRIGSPEALAVTLELGAWAAFYSLLSQLGAVYILVSSVGQSILMIFFFFGVGLEQGMSSVAGNLIGANRKDEVVRAFRSGLKIVGIFAFCLLSFLWLADEWIVDLFMQNPESLEGGSHLMKLSASEMEVARTYLLQSCVVIGIYIAIENIRCLLYGVLRAAGDTLFILLLSIAATWTLLLIPTYVLMTLWKMPVQVSFWIWLAYAFGSTSICFYRFAKGSWREKALFTA